MMKRSGNKSKDKDVFIPGQAYHMDLAFVSGPSNLEEVSTSTDKPKLTVKQSRDGYIGFLTIIDVASRQLWTHLIKNKDPPTNYINRFLSRHGIRNTDPSKAIITTSTKGYLAEPKAFETTVKQLQYKVQK